MSQFVGMSLAGTSTGAASLMTGLVAGEEKVLGTGHLFLPANTIRDNGVIEFSFSGLNTTATAANVFTIQLYHDTVPAVITAGASSGTAIFTTPTISVVDAAWVEADKAIILTGAFTAYTFMANDTFTATAGLDVLNTPSIITQKTSNDQIRVTDDLNSALGDEANGVDGFVTSGSAPHFAWTPGATDGWYLRIRLTVNRMATTTNNFVVLAELFLTTAFSDGTPATTTSQVVLKGGTISPNTAALTADSYIWATIKSTETAAAFTCTHANAEVIGRSQGIWTPGAY